MDWAAWVFDLPSSLSNRKGISRMDDKEARFRTGNIIFTHGVNERVSKDEEFAKFILDCLRRHVTGDWGDLCEEDRRENDYALSKYLRLLSAYQYCDRTKIWIITEADRSCTTVLFPNEY